jgi:hypothetical protein
MAHPESRNIPPRDLLRQIVLDARSGEHAADVDVPDSSDRDLADALKARARSFHEAHAFQPGDLVCWKPGLRNRTHPRDGRPAVVIGVLPEPVLDTERESGSSYFREPLDLLLGVYAERGDFLVWHYDSRRFQPWSPAE